jgi:hypothetical protein
VSDYWPESAVREVAILNDALDNATAEVSRLRAILSAAVEEVDADLVVWEQLRGKDYSADAMHAMVGLWIKTIRATLDGKT